MKTWTFLLTMLLSGCATVHINKSVHTREYENAQVLGSDVYVYLAGDTIPEACESVADIDASTQDVTHEFTQIIGRVREEAGKLGANAVQIQSMEREGPGLAEELAGFLGTLLGDPIYVQGDTDADAVALHCPTI